METRSWGPSASARTTSSAFAALGVGGEPPAGLDIEEQRSLAQVRRGLFGTAVAEPLRIDRYTLLHAVGAGAMGIVYAAHDPELARPVAIKLLQACGPSGWNDRHSLAREAQAMAKLSHPNVITVHDVGTYELSHPPSGGEEGRAPPRPCGVFVVMELVSGADLGTWLRSKDRGWAEILDVFVAAGRGLRAAHAVGLVHRDFKPANVIVTDAGEVKVLDFGLVRELPSPSAGGDDACGMGLETGGNDVTRLAGTPRYMAPEQFEGGPIDGRTDQFGFCVALYEALYGMLPFATRSLTESRHARIEGEIVPPPREARVPAWLFDLIAVGLAPRPEERHASMEALLAAIDHRRRRRSRALVGLGLTAAMVVAGGVGTALGTRLVSDQSVPPAPTASASIAAPMPVGTLTLAVLPVDDQTSDALAAGAHDALAHVAARELSVIPNANVIDYFALSRIVEPQPVRGTERPSRRRWIAAARTLGATTIVDGRLEDAGPGARVVLEVRDSDGALLHRSEQVTTPDALGDAMRSTAAHIAEAFGAPAFEIPIRHDHQWDYDRRLAEGRSHLERGRFDPACGALQAAVALRPETSEARFQLVLARSWMGQTDEALAEIERTLATAAPPRERAFLLGYQAHVAGRHAEAIARFREAAAAHPGDRYIDYGLFESLFHGGYPSEGIEVYRQRLGAVSPLVSIALMHALDHYAAHGNREGLQWAFELAPSVDSDFAEVWAVRLALFDRDYDQALEAASRLDGSHDPAASDELSIELHALAGRSWLARTLAEQLEARDPRRALLPLLALHTHSGSPQRERYRVRALAQATEAPRPLDRIHGLTAIALLELPTADHRLAELRDALHRAADGLGQPEARTATILALLAGAPYDATEIEAAQASELPQAQAIAYAYATEHEGDLHTALAQWDRALAAEMDGRFVPVLKWNKARVAAIAGRDDVVRATCAAIERPHSFHWSWAAVTAVEPCGAEPRRPSDQEGGEARWVEYHAPSMSRDPSGGDAPGVARTRAR